MSNFSFRLLLLLLIPMSLPAMKTSVTLQYGGDPQFREKAEKSLTDILNYCNAFYESGAVSESLADRLATRFDGEAFSEFNNLMKQTRPYASDSEYRTHMLQTAAGNFVVRDIRVRVSNSERQAVPYQYLVFTFDKYGLVTSVNFTIEKQRYQDILEEGKALDDLAYREKILHFLEIYRTAYNKKDREFIRKTLSDDALIIVGNVVKVHQQDSDLLQRSFLSNDQIQFLSLEKEAYLERLARAFARNDFIQIQFDQISISRHPRFERIYGIQLKQRWNSSTYGDEGYLFLMMDFVDAEQPIVHVRAWQPDRFEDGSTVSIFDFDIIE